MAARSVAPTKTNLLALRQELRLARQGHELLDQKRNILVIELLKLVLVGAILGMPATLSRLLL